MEQQVNGHFVVDAEVMADSFVIDARELQVIEQPKSQITDDMVKQLLAKIVEQDAAIAALKAEKEQRHTLSLKVAEKGGISVYGLGRFPVTLYPEQWEKIGKILPQIAEFAKANSNLIAERQIAAKAAAALEKANK